MQIQGKEVDRTKRSGDMTQQVQPLGFADAVPCLIPPVTGHPRLCFHPETLGGMTVFLY